MLPVRSRVERVNRIRQHCIEKIIAPHVCKLTLCNEWRYGNKKLISRPKRRRKGEWRYEKNNESEVIGIITPQCCINVIRKEGMQEGGRKETEKIERKGRKGKEMK